MVGKYKLDGNLGYLVKLFKQNKSLKKNFTKKSTLKWFIIVLKTDKSNINSRLHKFGTFISRLNTNN